jgi:hypothetical protein
MKKSTLFIALSLMVSAANAQTPLTLSGTSYSQNFDAMTPSGSTLPTGWYVDTAASSTSLGTVAVVTALGKPYVLPGGDTSCKSGSNSAFVTTRGFKNYPSATAIGTQPTVDICVNGDAITNRALGVRQVGATAYDPGAAIALYIANTTGLTNLNLAFKLQSLDSSSPRTVNWIVDYGIGANPSTFTTVTSTTGTWTTGNHTYTNNAVSASFGSGLNDQSGPFWIRIRPSAASTGSGNRPTTAIDDVSLTWTGTTGVSDVTATNGLQLNLVGEATTGKVTFACNTQSNGNYTLCIYDLSGRVVATQKVAVEAGNTQVTVGNLNLVSGMYIAKMSNEVNTAVVKVMVN